jgi:NAD(P)-dependent dehydrogenase (short-subunit alcohol dehydrogenase family)
MFVGKLDGKVAVITGAGSGMGRSAAVLFAQEGAKVVCADRSGLEEETAASIGAAALPVHADVGSVSDVERMIATAEEQFGQLDVLFNNAGFGGPMMPLHEQTLETWEVVLDTNLTGVFLGMKFGIQAMLRNGGGSIVSTASAAGLVGWKGHSVYGAAKAGVIQLTKAAALDYADQNIRVNAICPGMFWTGLVKGARDTGTVGQQPPSDAYPPPANVPMKRWGLASEIAAAALFLASDDSSFITGVALPVDGGFVCP